MPYLTYSDVQEFLNVTLSAGDQTFVGNLIKAVSAYVEKQTGRNWNSNANTDIVENFDGGINIFKPKQTPIASITSIVDNGQTLTTDQFHNYGNYIALEYVPNPGFRTIVITYKSSATVIPDDLKTALVMWVSQLYKSRTDAGKVADSVNTGPINIHYLTKDGVPAFVTEVIDSYRSLFV